MLARRVPAANDEDKSRRDAAFEGALHRAQGEQLCEVVGEADAEHDDAPGDHVQREETAHAVALQEEVGGELEGHVGDVEGGGEPGVLLSDEMRVFAQAKGGLGAERGFVGGLNAVAEPH